MLYSWKLFSFAFYVAMIFKKVCFLIIFFDDCIQNDIQLCTLTLYRKYSIEKPKLLETQWMNDSQFHYWWEYSFEFLIISLSNISITSKSLQLNEIFKKLYSNIANAIHDVNRLDKKEQQRLKTKRRIGKWKREEMYVASR